MEEEINPKVKKSSSRKCKIEKSDESEPDRELVFNEVAVALFESLAQPSSNELATKRDDLINQFLHLTLTKFSISAEYNISILYDKGKMIRSDADNIYSGVTSFTDKKPLLLILYSTGGDIGSAYLIGKLCREYSCNKLVTVIPREAKSAATLICCASDEIHMGSLSEMGPIDPQIGKLPALGLKNSVQHIADLVGQYPASAEMFAKYLELALEPIHLGYYERVAESSMQYAERLLKTHDQNLAKKADVIAHDLVYTYKDHGFVIDAAEALQIFGQKIVKKNTPEYELGNNVYQVLENIKRAADYAGYTFYFIGACDSKPFFIKKNR